VYDFDTRKEKLYRLYLNGVRVDYITDTRALKGILEADIEVIIKKIEEKDKTMNNKQEVNNSEYAGQHLEPDEEIEVVEYTEEGLYSFILKEEYTDVITKFLVMLGLSSSGSLDM